MLFVQYLLSLSKATFSSVLQTMVVYSCLERCPYRERCPHRERALVGGHRFRPNFGRVKFGIFVFSSFYFYAAVQWIHVW